MTEIRKPGGNSKVASVPFVFQLETFQFFFVGSC